MKVKTVQKIGKAIGKTTAGLTMLLIYAILATFSWSVTCGIYKVVSVCCAFTYGWKFATILWLIWFVPFMVASHWEYIRSFGGKTE